MTWLGLDWDEGPFFQSKRLDLYKGAAEKIVASGTPIPVSAPRKSWKRRRAEATAAGRPPMYDRRCRRLDRGRSCSISARLDFPARFGSRFPRAVRTSFDDAVFGKIEFANSRNRGLRAAALRWHSDLPPQRRCRRYGHAADAHHSRSRPYLEYAEAGAAISRAGRALPVFAHVPLILGPDKTRLSKRHGATSVISYKEMGIVPEAFRNFLALLGWSPKAAEKDREIFSSEELIQLFSLEGISKSNAVFETTSWPGSIRNTSAPTRRRSCCR